MYHQPIQQALEGHLIKKTRNTQQEVQIDRIIMWRTTSILMVTKVWCNPLKSASNWQKMTLSKQIKGDHTAQTGISPSLLNPDSVWTRKMNITTQCKRKDPLNKIKILDSSLTWETTKTSRITICKTKSSYSMIRLLMTCLWFNSIVLALWSKDWTWPKNT